MTRLLHLAAASSALVMCAGMYPATGRAAQAPAHGTMTGHVRLTGPAPANPALRMGADPRCSRATRGQRLTQELVLRSADGGLANAFVHLEGSFPAASPPSQPVTIDQRGCVFSPRVVGARVGQTLQLTNNDDTAHNLHSLSSKGNGFNTSQPVKGMKYTFQLKADDVMMRIKCDIHSWMVSYVGVTRHPYFAVSAVDGAFRIASVPPGRHTVRVWHEQYGFLSRTVDVKAGGAVTVNFSYTGKEKPSSAGVREFVVPGVPVDVEIVAAR